MWCGLGVDVIILEEAAFIDPAMFNTVCVPLMGVGKTALLAISTPDDEFSYYSQLFEMKKPDGRSLFYTISIGLACNACLEAGLQCGHLFHKLPAWKPMERQALVASILASNPDLAGKPHSV